MKSYAEKRLAYENLDAGDGHNGEIIHPGRTEELLANVVRLSDDLARSSEEKLNIALAVNSSVSDISDCTGQHIVQGSCKVERHIRLLDHAIRETQAALGAPIGTSAASIHLPDLVVPRWSRITRNSLSPVGNLDAGTDDPGCWTLYI